MSEESSVDINFTHDRNYYVINLIFLVFLEFHAHITAPGAKTYTAIAQLWWLAV